LRKPGLHPWLKGMDKPSNGILRKRLANPVY